jgi:hypothetical protein
MRSIRQRRIDRDEVKELLMKAVRGRQENDIE